MENEIIEIKTPEQVHETVVVPEITMEFLEKRPLSYSSLKQFRRSPLHYITYLTQKKEATPALIFGNMFDCLLLTPDEFEKRFVVAPEINKRTNAGKEQFEQFIEANKGKTIVTKEMIEGANKMIESVNNHRVASEILKANGTVQRKMNWVDTKTKLPCTMQSDFDSDEINIVCDIKSTTDASESKFMRDAFEYGYHIQCAMYLEAFRRKMFRFPRFAFIVIEKEPPFAVNVFNKISESFIKLGQQEIETLRQEFVHAMENKLFNQAYDFRSVDGGSILDLPAYAKHRIHE